MHVASTLRIVLLLFAASTVHVRSQPMNDGKRVTGPNIASKDAFTAQLWLTEHEDFFRKFAQGGNIRFGATSKVKRDVPVFITFFISGPGVGASGAAHVAVDIIVRRPDGTVYFEGRDAPCWTGTYPCAPDSTQVGDAKVKLRIEPKDPVGQYAVEATVHDKIKKLSLPLKKTFDVAQ